jgi:hypothetical protein
MSFLLLLYHLHAWVCTWVCAWVCMCGCGCGCAACGYACGCECARGCGFACAWVWTKGVGVITSKYSCKRFNLLRCWIVLTVQRGSVARVEKERLVLSHFHCPPQLWIEEGLLSQPAWYGREYACLPNPEKSAYQHTAEWYKPKKVVAAN